MTSTQAPVVAGTADPRDVAPNAGALFQFSVPSVQVVVVPWTNAVFALLSDTHSRSLTELTVPLTPVTLNLT